MNPVAQVSTVYFRPKDADESIPAYKHVGVWCPGCEMMHHFTIEVFNNFERSPGSPPPTWQWDGNLESPTFSPSLLCYSSAHRCEPKKHYVPCEDYDNCEEKTHMILNDDWRANGPKEYGHQTPHTADPVWGNCHSFLRNGVWEFLGDSAHKLAGQNVPLTPLPDWAVNEK